MPHHSRLATAALCLWLLTGATASGAEDLFLASVKLRSGFDANPRLIAGGPGSAIAGFDAAFVAGQDTGDWTIGVTGEGSRTQYLRGIIDPAERYKTSLDIANKDQAGIAFRSTSRVESIRNFQLRSLDATQRLRLQYVGGALRPFLTAELRYATLNETNAIFTDFLPQDQRYVRVTAIPGLALKQGGLEVGASLNLSATRYADKFDVFGFRRDNERYQPFAFVRYEDKDYSLFANVSRLHGNWHDADFTDLRKTLFEATLTTRQKPVRFELSARRFAAETTFPVSPVVLMTAYSGKAIWQVDEKSSLSAYARSIHTDYPDSPFSSKEIGFGLGYEREWRKDFYLGADLSVARFTPIAGEAANTYVATLSVIKRFAPDEGEGLAPRSIPSAPRTGAEAEILRGPAGRANGGKRF